MQTWYIEIFAEAANLRNAEIKDPRLEVLDKAMADFKAEVELSDRTGTGQDNHYKVSFPDNMDETGFVEYMMGIPEVVIISMKPVEQNRVIDESVKGEIGAIGRRNYTKWNNCEGRAEVNYDEEIVDIVTQNTCYPNPEN